MSSSINNKVFGSILLVAGTQIGAGMLALPITTGIAGFLPATCLFIGAFIYMLMNLFVLLEANLYCQQRDANIISIAKDQLGKPAQILAWVSFLLLLYSASAAYISGGTSLIVSELKPFLDISNTQGLWLFSLIFGAVAYFGIVWIDRLNRLLMAGLVLSYIASVLFILPKVHVHNLLASHAQFLWAAIPVVILSFTSHIVVPSICSYLDRKVSLIKRTLLIGSIVPCALYLIWELSLVGAIPSHGEQGLLSIAASAAPLATLTHILSEMHLPIVANSNLFFSLFALITSFLGVILSLCDFLADGFNIPKNRQGRALLMFLSFAPPLTFAIFFPESFVLALGYAGVFVAILYGILPSLIVWRARYHMHLKAEQYRFFGNRIVLGLLILISLVVIVLQILMTQNLLPTP